MVSGRSWQARLLVRSSESETSPIAEGRRTARLHGYRCRLVSLLWLLSHRPFRETDDRGVVFASPLSEDFLPCNMTRITYSTEPRIGKYLPRPSALGRTTSKSIRLKAYARSSTSSMEASTALLSFGCSACDSTLAFTTSFAARMTYTLQKKALIWLCGRGSDAILRAKHGTSTIRISRSTRTRNDVHGVRGQESVMHMYNELAA